MNGVRKNEVLTKSNNNIEIFLLPSNIGYPPVPKVTVFDTYTTNCLKLGQTDNIEFTNTNNT